MNTHIVTKRLPMGDGYVEIGAEVDASEWRNTRLLEEQRYIRPIDNAREDKSKEKKHGTRTGQ